MSWTNHNDYTGATIAIRNASSHEVARKYLEDFCAERDAVEDAEWERLEAENAKLRDELAQWRKEAA